MQTFLHWIDVRTGYRLILDRFRSRVLPTGPSWWLTSGSCLFWLFVVQLFTGLLLMTTYSPSATSAWASVHFIELSPWGSFLRGVHFYTAHTLIVVFAVHVLRVLLTAGFRAPRELIWLTGIVLVPLILAWAVSGNPLCGSQKGMAQIEVEGNIIGSTPLIGPSLQRLLIGGEEVGHLTLTHLYFLHVGLLPLLAIGVLAVHIMQVYRHGLSSEGIGDGRSNVPYWPYQSVRNTVVLTVVLAGISLLAWRYGAPLDAPADAELASMPRPEWYFRCLFELRRYFTGEWEFVATLVFPLVLLILFVSLPFLDLPLSRRFSSALRGLIALGCLAGWGWLTGVSLFRDWNDPDYRAAHREAARLAARARVLANRQQIPPQGAAALLRADSQTRGPLLFARHCAACHSHVPSLPGDMAAADSSAPNLYGFGSQKWIEGLLDPDAIISPQYFGKTKFADGDMASHIKGLFADAADAAELRDKLQLAALALAAEAELLPNVSSSEHATAIAAGRKILVGELGCTDCHRFHGEGDLGSAPDLTGYGSRQWLSEMIANPQGERFYGDGRNDRMPAFANDPKHPKQNLLSPEELDLLVNWLRGQWFEPQGAPDHSPQDDSPEQVVGD